MRPYSNKALRIAALVVRMLLGAFFICSAVAKLIDIDRFEVHVFSYNILSLNLSFLAARLVIVCELLVGIGLLANVFHRLVNICSLLMLVGFTMFLGYAALMGRTDSCQCMGPLLEINPTQSMLKNALLILLMLFAMGCAPWKMETPMVCVAPCRGGHPGDHLLHLSPRQLALSCQRRSV